MDNPHFHYSTITGLPAIGGTYNEICGFYSDTNFFSILCYLECLFNSISLILFFNFLCLYRVTCVYLACKVEEFNVSISQFVSNIKGDREKASDIILNNELLLMLHLNYNLTIHNPYRPVEGLLIDIKVSMGPRIINL